MTPKLKAITTDGKWVEGKLIDENMIRVYSRRESHDGRLKKRIHTDHEVIPETVCVGFKIGEKTIFHGDKVKHNDKEFIAVITENAGFVLIENNDSFGIVLNDRLLRQKHNHRNQLWMYNVSKYLKTTGNIHDHLLKP